MSYWLPPVPAAEFISNVQDVCTRYREAPHLANQGERVVSTDALTGVQALERQHPGVPLAPAKVERREFEYSRHGTRAFILSREVGSGHLMAPRGGPTRPEADCLSPVQGGVATAPAVTRWHFIGDTLNTHQAASRVQGVAAKSELDIDRGQKGAGGLLPT